MYRTTLNSEEVICTDLLMATESISKMLAYCGELYVALLEKTKFVREIATLNAI
jgi:hypothetical protein